MSTEKITLDMIDIKKMTRPSKAKLKHYGVFYDLTGRLSHDIYINNNKEIIAGYCSYLIAKNHNYTNFKVHLVNNNQLTKVVYCKHMLYKNGKIKLYHKTYAYVYPLKNAVVPGDIVKAKHKSYYNTLVVQSIEYYEKDSMPNITATIYKTTPYILSKDKDNNFIKTKRYNHQHS